MKRRSAPRKPYPIEVIWRDTTSHASWHGRADALEMAPVNVRSTGYLLKRTKTCLTLAAHYVAEDDSFGHIHAIPTDWTISIRRLR